MGIESRLDAMYKRVMKKHRKAVSDDVPFCECPQSVPPVIITDENKEARQEIINKQRICPRCGKPRRRLNIFYFITDNSRKA